MGNAPNLKVIAGSAGRGTLKLSKPVTLIGSEPTADLSVTGGKVSPQHAIIETTDGHSFVLRNRSSFGTFVNKSRVDIHTLANGDRIQIGEGALLEFNLGISDPKSKGKGSALSVKKILIGTALVAYLCGMAWFVMVLQGISDSSDVLTSASLKKVLSDTGVELQAASTDGISSGTLGGAVDDQYPAAMYFRLRNAVQQGADPATVSSLSSGLLESVQTEFKDARVLEQQQRWKDAERHYRQILEMLPDNRLAASRLAASRLAALARKQLNE
jgi:hypothetical protein